MEDQHKGLHVWLAVASYVSPRLPFSKPNKVFACRKPFCMCLGSRPDDLGTRGISFELKNILPFRRVVKGGGVREIKRGYVKIVAAVVVVLLGNSSASM